MAIEIRGFRFSAKAASDLSDNQYNFVKLTEDMTVDVCSAVTDEPCGILQNAPVAGQAAEIVVEGISKIKVGAGALTYGARVSTGATGLAVAEAELSYTVGKMMADAGAGAIGSVLFNCFSPYLKPDTTP